MQWFASHLSLRWLALLGLSLGCNLTGIDTAESSGPGSCEIFIDDYGDADGAACAEDLACESYTDAESCGFGPFVNGENGLSVGCHWGKRFIGGYAGEMCGGEVDEVCVAAVLVGEGGPPCAGYFADLDDGVEVLNLSCAEPIVSSYSACAGTPYEEGVCTCAAG